MNLETSPLNLDAIHTQFAAKLGEFLTVNSVKVKRANPGTLRDASMNGLEVACIEFIVNRDIRMYTFAIESKGRIAFTRPKEGILRFLLCELKSYDFYFYITESINDRFNLIGRIVDSVVGLMAAKDIKRRLQKACEQSGNDLQYSDGYKVTFTHRHTQTYDAFFEVIVEKHGRFVQYDGIIKNGQIVSLTDDQGPIKLSDIFEI
jgi:hypothetical protein